MNIINDDCLKALEGIESNSVDAIVTDPPYELNFMGKGWDNAGVSFQKETWEKCLRVLKPGGYLLAFGGTRTYHRIACAIEDAGFEIRDCIQWIFGQGFPKSMNIGLAIDRKNGVESKVVGKGKSGVSSRAYQSEETTTAGGYEIKEAQNGWNGWGTALKPSYEPIIVARKPFKGSLVDNVMKYGVGGLNIDECRVETTDTISTHSKSDAAAKSKGIYGDYGGVPTSQSESQKLGRFPANTILTYDETDFDEVCGGFPNTKCGMAIRHNSGGNTFGGNNKKPPMKDLGYNDNGSAARYFYCAKASKKDRNEGLEEFEEKNTMCDRNPELASANMPQNRSGNLRKNTHPTVKPTNLMQYLIRLVAPKGATILDPFMGSGSTGKAVAYENVERDAGYNFIGIEREAEYCEIARARIEYVK